MKVSVSTNDRKARHPYTMSNFEWSDLSVKSKTRELMSEKEFKKFCKQRKKQWKQERNMTA